VARQPITRPTAATIQERFAAEVIGTALLTFIGAATAAAGLMILHNTSQVSRPSDLLIFALAQGLVVFAAYAALARISGAHLNPAVTIALAAIRRFPLEDVWAYILAQFVGGIIGAAGVLLVYGMLPISAAHLGAPTLGTNINIWQGLAAEAIGAFLLVFTFIATAVDDRAIPGWAGLAIGLALAAGILAVGYAVGATAFNPARTLGPLLVGLPFGRSVDWLAFVVSYLIGPLLGGVVAAFVYRFIARLPRSRL
jgi:glycerol uptake facilitator protein